eukprot:7160205-Prymnesium_polylepis.1
MARRPAARRAVAASTASTATASTARRSTFRRARRGRRCRRCARRSASTWRSRRSGGCRRAGARRPRVRARCRSAVPPRRRLGAAGRWCGRRGWCSASGSGRSGAGRSSLLGYRGGCGCRAPSRERAARGRRGATAARAQSLCFGNARRAPACAVGGVRATRRRSRPSALGGSSAKRALSLLSEVDEEPRPRAARCAVGIRGTPGAKRAKMAGRKTKTDTSGDVMSSAWPWAIPTALFTIKSDNFVFRPV